EIGSRVCTGMLQGGPQASGSRAYGTNPTAALCERSGRSTLEWEYMLVGRKYNGGRLHTGDGTQSDLFRRQSGVHHTGRTAPAGASRRQK
ncbi:MAG: hypothetical protein OXC69_01090, partial [Candidatus Tectomicrobia bacterium]|nr:hypothetical protein [Candidatus Tectomicrobia bacterium]